MANRTRVRYPLAVYFALACAISWAFMVPAFVIAEQLGAYLPPKPWFDKRQLFGKAQGS